MNDDAVAMAVQVAQMRPHIHIVDGQEVGHHRLMFVGPGVEVTCGWESPHRRHDWTEMRRTFPCPGKEIE